MRRDWTQAAACSTWARAPPAGLAYWTPASVRPPGTAPDQIIALIAGGREAVFHAMEKAEDDESAAGTTLREHHLAPQDCVIGIAASGRTPYVLAGLQHARRTGALTIGLSVNPHSAMAAIVDIAINPDTGPEVLTGSSRLKAGTAQKMVLNMISTAGMVRLGKVFGNLMVDVAVTNAKLEARQARIVMQACNCDHKKAEELLAASGRHCKTAIQMPLGKLDAQGARSLLANHKGRLLPAIMAAGQKKATRHD